MRAGELIKNGERVNESHSFLIIKYCFSGSKYGARHYMFKKTGLKLVCPQLLNNKLLHKYNMLCNIENERFRDKDNQKSRDERRKACCN
jgi:hypothetical protein